MSNNLPINWADKKNSPVLADFIAKYGAEYCMTAEEINQMRDAVNEMALIQKTTFLGVAEPTDTPAGTGRGYWEVITPGTYTSFGGVVLGPDERGLIARDETGAFKLSKVEFDFSKYEKKEYTRTLKVGKNLFDKTKISAGNYIDTDTGLLVYIGVGWNTTDYISCKEGYAYISNLPFSFISFYDVNKVFISGISAAGQYYITVPVGAEFFRNSGGESIEDIQIEKGIYSTTYEPYEVIYKDNFISKDNISDYFTSENEKVASEKLLYSIREDLNRIVSFDETNLFDKSKVILGAYPEPNNNGELHILSGWKSSDFIKVNELTTYVMNDTFSFVCYYDEQKEFISGISNGGQTLMNTPINCVWMRVNINNYETNQIQLGSVVTDYKPYRNGRNNVEYTQKTTTIVATRNGSNYNSIREIMESITDATNSNKYVIYVPNGRWFESDIKGKENIEIVGEDKYRTILYCDGTSSLYTPSNYSFTWLSNQPLRDISANYKHCVNARKNIKMSNLTIEVNETKYCVHLDDPGYQKAEFNNVNFLVLDLTRCVGIGTGGQQILIDGCDFNCNEVNTGIFIHNWPNSNYGPSIVTIRNSIFIGCNYATIDELGSNHNDVYELLNCSSTIDAYLEWMVDVDISNSKTFWVNPATGLTETNPANIPYFIKLNVSGTKISEMNTRSSPYGGFGPMRPNFADYTIGLNSSFSFSKNNNIPETLTSLGYKGEVRVSENGVYFCISKNLWKYLPF